MKEKITILIPLFNDNASINLLLKNISAVFTANPYADIAVLIVDDGSSEPLTIQTPCNFEIQVLHLQRNIGHQKAIVIGLAFIKDKIHADKVLIMDADGQDSPADALRLTQTASENPDKIVFAARKSRQEGFRFRFFYSLYKLLFRILTGKQISFGNFLILPKTALNKIVFYSEIWSHLSGGIVKSGLPYMAIKADRDKRYYDESKMNFNALILHGLGAIAVFLDILAIRLLIFSFIMIIASLLAILVIIGVKAFTDLAIPGWTSTVVSSLTIILLQSFLFSLFTVFLYLSSQSQRKFIPGHHYNDYLHSTEKITGTVSLPLND